MRNLNALGKLHGGESDIAMTPYNLNSCKSAEEADKWKAQAKEARDMAKWTKVKFESLTSLSRSWRDMDIFKNAFLKSHLRDDLAVRKSNMSLQQSRQKYVQALNDAHNKYSLTGGKALLPF